MSGSAGGNQSRGDFAGDEAGFADASEDDSLVGAGGFGEEAGGGVEDGLRGALKAGGELLKGVGFDTDEFSGCRWEGCGFVADLRFVRHG